jgi:hypothetical protein
MNAKGFELQPKTPAPNSITLMRIAGRETGSR